MPRASPRSRVPPGPDHVTSPRAVSGRSQHAAVASVGGCPLSPTGGGSTHFDGNHAATSSATFAGFTGVGGVGGGSGGAGGGGGVGGGGGGGVSSPSGAFGTGVGLGGLDAVAVTSPRTAVEAALRAAAVAAATATAAAAERSPRSRPSSPAAWRRPLASCTTTSSTGPARLPPAVSVDGPTAAAAAAAAAAASMPASAVLAEVGGMLPRLSLPASERSRAARGWDRPPERDLQPVEESTVVVAHVAAAVAVAAVTGVGRVLSESAPDGDSGRGASMSTPARASPVATSRHVASASLPVGRTAVPRAVWAPSSFAAGIAAPFDGAQPSLTTPAPAAQHEEEPLTERGEEPLAGPGGWTIDGTWTTREIAKGALVLGCLRLVAVELSGVPDPSSLREVSLASNALSGIDLTPLALCSSLEALVLNANELTAIDLTPLAACPKLERLWLHNNKLATVNLTALANCRGLRSLYLDGNALHDCSVALAPLAACRLLRSLRLGRNRLGGQLDISCLLSAAALSTLDVSASVTLVAHVTAETSNASSAAAALPPALRRKAASVVWRQVDSPPRTPEPEPQLEADGRHVSGLSSVLSQPVVVQGAAALTHEAVRNGALSARLLPSELLAATRYPSSPSLSSTSHDVQANIVACNVCDSPFVSIKDGSAHSDCTAVADCPLGASPHVHVPFSQRTACAGGSAQSVSSASSGSTGAVDKPPLKLRFCVLLVGFRGTSRYGVEALLSENSDVGTAAVPCAVLEAQSALSLVPAHVHVVVVEVDLSSEALIVALRAVDATVPIVIVGRTDVSADAASRCLRRGASCFLTQPLSGRDAITVRSLAQKRARSLPSIKPDLSVWAALRPCSSSSSSSLTDGAGESRPSGLIKIARDIVSGSTPEGSGSLPLLVPSALPRLVASPPSFISLASSSGSSPTIGGVLGHAPSGSVGTSTVRTRVLTNGHPPLGRQAVLRPQAFIPPPLHPWDVAVDFSVLRARALRLAHGGGSSSSGSNFVARARVEESALRMLFSRCGGAAGKSAFPSIATLCGLPVCVSDVFFYTTCRFAASASTPVAPAMADKLEGSASAVATPVLSSACVGGGCDVGCSERVSNVNGSASVRPALAPFRSSLSRSLSAVPTVMVSSGRFAKERVTYSVFSAFWQEQLRECDAETRLFNVLRESPVTLAVAASAVSMVVRSLIATRQSRSGVGGGGWRSLPTSRSASPVGGLPPSSSSSNLLSDVNRGLGGGGSEKGRAAERTLCAAEEADVAIALVLYALRGSRWSALRLRDFRRSAFCAALLSAESGVYGGVVAGLRCDRIAEARDAFVAALTLTDGSHAHQPLYRPHLSLGRVRLLSRQAMVAYNAARGLLTPTAVDALFSRRCASSRSAQRRQRRIKAAYPAARVSWAAVGEGVDSGDPGVGVAAGHVLDGEGPKSAGSSALIQGPAEDAHLSSPEFLLSSDESGPVADEEAGLDVAEFAVFWTATQDASTRSAAEYFFDVLDVDLDGRFTAADAAHFYADKRRLMQAEGLEPAEFGDVWHYATDMMLAASREAERSRLLPSPCRGASAADGRFSGRALLGSVAPAMGTASPTLASTLPPPSFSAVGGHPPLRWRRGPRPPFPSLFAPEAIPAFAMAITLPSFRSAPERDRSDILQALLCREDNGALVDLHKTGQRATDGVPVGDAVGTAGDAAGTAAVGVVATELSTTAFDAALASASNGV